MEWRHILTVFLYRRQITKEGTKISTGKIVLTTLHWVDHEQSRRGQVNLA